MRFNITVITFLFFLFNTLIAQAQYIELGHSRQEVLKKLGEAKKEISRNKKLQMKRFNIVDRLEDTVHIPNRPSGPVIVDLELFRVPYTNTRQEYYFNAQGYCDSMVVTENACWDCMALEEGDKLLLFWIKWKKIAQGKYVSEYPFYIFYENWTRKSKDRQISYATALKNDMPSDGTCRKWIFTLGSLSSYDAYEKGYLSEMKKQKSKTKS